MTENLNFPELIESIFLKEDNNNRRIGSEEAIELIFDEYWDGDNIWFKEKWKEFRELDGNNMMFDLKSRFRKFKSLLQDELEAGYDDELLLKDIIKVNEDGVCFVGFSSSFKEVEEIETTSEDPELIIESESAIIDQEENSVEENELLNDLENTVEDFVEDAILEEELKQEEQEEVEESVLPIADSSTNLKEEEISEVNVEEALINTEEQEEELLLVSEEALISEDEESEVAEVNIAETIMEQTEPVDLNSISIDSYISNEEESLENDILEEEILEEASFKNDIVSEDNILEGENETAVEEVLENENYASEVLNPPLTQVDLENDLEENANLEENFNIVEVSDINSNSDIIIEDDIVIEDKSLSAETSEEEPFSYEDISANGENVISSPVIIEEEEENEVSFLSEEGEIINPEIDFDTIGEKAEEAAIDDDSNDNSVESELKEDSPTKSKVILEQQAPLNLSKNIFLDNNYGALMPSVSNALGNFGIKNPFDRVEKTESIQSEESLENEEEVTQYNPEQPENLTFADHLPEEAICELDDEVEAIVEDSEDNRVLIAEDTGFKIFEVVEEEEKVKISSELELLPILSQFIRSNHNFNAYSKSMTAPENAWNHPGIVALGGDICNVKNDELFNEFAGSSVQDILKIYSFNVQIEVSLYNMREYFFQTVSNSNWANEGYLVISSIEKDNNRVIREDELKRLSAFYGIGVILLDVEESENSELISLSEARMKLDMNFINKLISNSTNTEFRDFIANINEVKKTGEFIEDFFDKIPSTEEVSKSNLKYLTHKK